MKSFIKIFCNVAILLGCIGFLIASIMQIISASDKIKDLNLKAGIVEEKYDTFYIVSNKRKDVVLIKLSDDSTTYWASRKTYYIDHYLNIGDSVLLYTKKQSSKNLNAVIDESSIWFTQEPNEIFHLVEVSGNYAIIDFKENQHNLLKMIWVFPLCALLFLGWFLYRRLGLKSIFISGW